MGWALGTGWGLELSMEHITYLKHSKTNKIIPTPSPCGRCWCPLQIASIVFSSSVCAPPASAGFASTCKWKRTVLRQWSCMPIGKTGTTQESSFPLRWTVDDDWLMSAYKNPASCLKVGQLWNGVYIPELLTASGCLGLNWKLLFCLASCLSLSSLLPLPYWFLPGSFP